MSLRRPERTISAVDTSDGAGVRLRRSIGQSGATRLDPFLMLDEFGTERPEDYIAGFPPHPHRGFETVTYMLDGRMRHEDHMGNVGDLGPGDVQWMTAGRGVIHSEMPQQEEGRMRGFQLWVNLPAKQKMQPASYRDIPAAEIPQQAFAHGTVAVIAGSLPGLRGAVVDNATQVHLFDVRFESAGSFEAALPAGHSVFVYAYEGSLDAGPDDDRVPLVTGAATVFGPGERLELIARTPGSRALVVAGRPLAEPVEQYGPFVMNTREQIEQALRDFRDGRLTEPA